MAGKKKNPHKAQARPNPIKKQGHTAAKANLPSVDTDTAPPPPPILAGLCIPLLRATFCADIGLRGKAGHSPDTTRSVSVEASNKHEVGGLWTDGYFVYFQSGKYQPKAVPCANVLDTEPIGEIFMGAPSPVWPVVVDERAAEGPNDEQIAEDVAAAIKAIKESRPLCAGTKEFVAIVDDQQFGRPCPGCADCCTDEELYAIKLTEDHVGEALLSPGEVVVTEIDADADAPYIVHDNADFLPNDSVAEWLQEQIAQMDNMEPGEYNVLNYDPELMLVRIQGPDPSMMIPIKLLPELV